MFPRWFCWVSDYIQATVADAAFVVTNSIYQGIKVPALWPAAACFHFWAKGVHGLKLSSAGSPNAAVQLHKTGHSCIPQHSTMDTKRWIRSHGGTTRLRSAIWIRYRGLERRQSNAQHWHLACAGGPSVASVRLCRDALPAHLQPLLSWRSGSVHRALRPPGRPSGQPRHSRRTE